MRSASKRKRRLLRSRVTSGIVIKLFGSDNRGGITVKTVQIALAHMIIIVQLHYQLAKPVRRTDSLRLSEYFTPYPLKPVLNWANINYTSRT